MLRCTQGWLGRWSSRDFLRGRSKRAGAVHTRHTHGRQGRYKRLSSIFSSVRDGRRHAGNHMQGGLGIKLGGGLFGLRIPRQHQLSHMSKEEFELEMYGHPNITNPYREHLNEHPDLQSVMMNASVTVKMVVLLPRASRGGGTGAPARWRRVAQEVNAALKLLAPPSAATAVDTAALPTSGDRSGAVHAFTTPTVEVHFATLETSVCCHWPPSPAPALTSQPTTGSQAVSLATCLEEGVARLYRAHCKFGQTLRLENASASRASGASLHQRQSRPPSAHHRRRPAVFMGATLKTPSSSNNRGTTVAVASRLPSPPNSAVSAASSCSSKSFTSSVLAQLTRDVSASVDLPLSSTAVKVAGSSSTVFNGDGLADVVRRLNTTEQPLLRVCVRPTSIGSFLTDYATPAAVATTTAPPPVRKVLKSKVDVNADVGVWKLPSSALQKLLRWHYCAHDPRAHNHDALPHHRRSLPLLVVVDYSTVVPPSTRLSASSASSAAPVPVAVTTDRRGETRPTSMSNPTATAATLMPRRLSLELESAGFKVVNETSLCAFAEALAAWSPSAQWERLAQSSAVSSSSSLPHAAHHHATATTAC